jgi:hypothetical protein
MDQDQSEPAPSMHEEDDEDEVNDEEDEDEEDEDDEEDDNVVDDTDEFIPEWIQTVWKSTHPAHNIGEKCNKKTITTFSTENKKNVYGWTRGMINTEDEINLAQFDLVYKSSCGCLNEETLQEVSEI